VELLPVTNYIGSDTKILSGEPIIAGTRTPVRSIVEKWRLGMTAEEIVQGSPYLTMAQVFASLSYYWDHRKEIDAFIERNRVPEELIDPAVRDL
jgi:uncharacterized protein (DUF433 family)